MFDSSQSVDKTVRDYEPRSSVLLAVPDQLEPDEALQRASTLCEIFDAELFVLRVTSTRVASTGTRLAEAKGVDGRHGIATETLGWCKHVLGEELPGDHVSVDDADFRVAVIAAARAVQPALVVVPYIESYDGALITRIVRETTLPVLASRCRGETDAIVAATDLSDGRYPVLREGLRIARGQVAPITFIHNVVPDAFSSAAHRLFSRSVMSLDDIDRQLNARCVRITTNRTHSADAILQVAEDQRADLIVVGAHLKPRYERSRRRVSVGSQVIERAGGSVLVVPVSG